VHSVVDRVATLVNVVALLAAAAAGLYAVLNRPPDRLLYAGLGILEAVLLVQAVLGGILLTGDDAPAKGEDVATFIGYLLTSLLVPPATALWAHSERSRSGTVVLAVGCLVIPVLVIRAQQVWSGTHV
jgi:4-amino-4-deoxy-L-arabinose transferase-like glycosyltransferase